MLELNKLEVLNLYFLLSERTDLSEKINSVLMKLEIEVFESYTVREIEGYRSVFNDKGRI